MLIILASPDALVRQGKLDQKLIDALKQTRASGNPTALVSNHGKPRVVRTLHLAEAEYSFLQERGRQGGAIVARNAAKFSLKSFDALVLASERRRKRSRWGRTAERYWWRVVWSSDRQVAALGSQIASAADLSQVIDLPAGWSGTWWYTGNAARYGVRALSDLSTKKYGLTNTQQAFAVGLTSTVKNGGAKLNALLAVTARSLLMEAFGAKDRLVWGVYPSSKSDNKDSEVLSDFTHRLRTTSFCHEFDLLRKANRYLSGIDLLLKSLQSGSGDRTDPTEQLFLTLHLNPYYAESGRLVGKNVVVIDDCTTYGVSFGVASAFLRAAGASSVTGVALGKFGSQLRYYEIDIASDPFKPLVSNKFKIVASTAMAGATNPAAQASLQDLID